jgi:hypothetical protein
MRKPEPERGRDVEAANRKLQPILTKKGFLDDNPGHPKAAGCLGSLIGLVERFPCGPVLKRCPQLAREELRISCLQQVGPR